jgi:hypothetical protein
MRFIIVENALGAQVYLPNSTITNVVSYPLGCMRCHVDVRLGRKTDTSGLMEEKVVDIVNGFNERFPGISVHPPSLEGRSLSGGGVSFLRVKFRLWPGREGCGNDPAPGTRIRNRGNRAFMQGLDGHGQL